MCQRKIGVKLIKSMVFILFVLNLGFYSSICYSADNKTNSTNTKDYFKYTSPLIHRKPFVDHRYNDWVGKKVAKDYERAKREEEKRTGKKSFEPNFNGTHGQAK